MPYPDDDSCPECGYVNGSGIECNNCPTECPDCGDIYDDEDDDECPACYISEFYENLTISQRIALELLIESEKRRRSKEIEKTMKRMKELTEKFQQEKQSI